MENNKEESFSLTREGKVMLFRLAAGKTSIFEDNGADLESVVTCFNEEAIEMLEALQIWLTDKDEDSRANFVKEWADVQYVLSQLAVYFNINGEEAFNRVAKNNMTKIGPNGEVKLREDGKILKPDNYVPVDMKGL